MDSIVPPSQQPNQQSPFPLQRPQQWKPQAQPDPIVEAPAIEPVEEFDEIPFVQPPAETYQIPVQQHQAPIIQEPVVPSYVIDPAQAYFSDAPKEQEVEEIHFVDTSVDSDQVVEEATAYSSQPQPTYNQQTYIQPESIQQSESVQSEQTIPIEETPVEEEIPEVNTPTEEVIEEPVAIETPVEDAPTEKVSYADSNIQEINISDVVANPYQPRTQFKPEALQELANSIKEHGVIQPLVVTKTPNGFEIVVGERRFRASQLAGLTKIPAIVKSSLHDQTKLEVALIENTQRQDLNAIEEARGYDRMIKEFSLTQDQVARKVGKSRSAVANTLRLLNLPAEIQRGVIEGKITEGHARAILGLGEIEKMILMYSTIQEQGLNVRQVEAKVREITVKRRMDAATPDPKLMALETELRGKLRTQVKIQRQGRGGKITIDFFSDEDLEEIMNRIAEQKASGEDNYLVV